MLKSFITTLSYIMTSCMINWPYRRKSTHKSILLIRLDAIGDYVLFRNYIAVLKKEGEYKDYKITLVGNIVWKELAEVLDDDKIDRFVWVDRKKFDKDWFYRYKKLKEIGSQRYKIVIHATFSREFYYGDWIVKTVQAEKKIGSEGDLSNISRWRKKISDRFYTRLIPAKEGVMFEFYRNREFFENFLGANIDVKKPMIQSTTSIEKFALPKNYIVLFIGASDESRIWSIENFVEIAAYVVDRFGYEVVICGGPADIENAEKFEELFHKRFFNLVGVTTLSELSAILYAAKLLISNETGAVHIAVAVDTPVLVLSNGNQLGRFNPYPKDITKKYRILYHPLIENNLNNDAELTKFYGKESVLDINEIKPERVKKEIDAIISSCGE